MVRMAITNSSRPSSTLRRVCGRTAGAGTPPPPPMGDEAGMAVAVTTVFLFASARQQLAPGVGVGVVVGDGGMAGSPADAVALPLGFAVVADTERDAELESEGCAVGQACLRERLFGSSSWDSLSRACAS